ncbi:importin subunit alpha-1 [Reticulomyxa filosa]|uniref:Importin subunit alpha-1 n=1 Tax=Reticulomyxa filosa TaxID=46433 RepID=X6M6Y8_RETFI|nr:importin subunit alpha-1 [Reticulomyxa filosa]|eukprot:ETO09763.1 importin subunit alpha-1 [Reticulomyxa filosa]
MITGTPTQTQVILKKLFVSVFVVVFFFFCLYLCLDIINEACWIVSNVTATDSEHVEQVIQANLIQPLIFLLKNGCPVVRKEAAWALTNAVAVGDTKQVRFLVNQKLIPALLDVIKSSKHSPTLMVAVEAIRCICALGAKEKHTTEGINQYASFVELAGGLDILEELQTRDAHEKVIEKAEDVLKTYFEGDDKIIHTQDMHEATYPFTDTNMFTTDDSNMNTQNGNSVDMFKF